MYANKLEILLNYSVNYRISQQDYPPFWLIEWIIDHYVLLEVPINIILLRGYIKKYHYYSGDIINKPIEGLIKVESNYYSYRSSAGKIYPLAKSEYGKTWIAEKVYLDGVNKQSLQLLIKRFQITGFKCDQILIEKYLIESTK